eukprot:1850349-Alexandrium_andersonii.AAC.1
MLRLFLGPRSSSFERMKQFRIFGSSNAESLLFGEDAGRYDGGDDEGDDNHDYDDADDGKDADALWQHW